jgi:hypothetical protein
MVTNGIMLWTVPATGNYTFQIAGARGGYDYYGGSIGRGRIINATLTLTQGQVIKILAGRRGGYAYAPTSCGAWSNPTYIGGGGGGSFIVDANNNPVLIAGGGGGMGFGNNGSGGGTQYVVDAAAYNSTTGEYGNPSSGAPGTNGNAGAQGWGSGGAGFYQNGPTLANYGGYPGSSWANGMLGGGNYIWSGSFSSSVDGGFGGGSGGGIHQCFMSQGGGGGGYSGGGGSGGNNGGSGGGGNYISGSTLVAVSGVSDSGLNTGDGYVTITKV